MTLMKNLFLFCLLCLTTQGFSQPDSSISTVSFVQIQDNHRAETLFYFNNNWKILRAMALKKNYIKSYQFFETPYSDDAPYDIILITTYQDSTQYKLREDHFTELIEAKGPLRLLNDLQPGDFRKTLYSKENVRAWH